MASKKTKPKARVKKTRGWQELKRLVDSESQSAIADRIGVKQPILSAIVNLQRLPGRVTLFRLEEGLGIQGTWWMIPPVKTERAA